MLQGIAIIGMGVGTAVTTAVACAVIGVTAGAASALLGAVFMATVDGAYLGRMSSILRLGDDVLMPASMVCFGALAGAAGVGAACAAYGLAMAGLMVLPLSRPAIRRISLARGDGATATQEARDPAALDA